jgi:hypothetical protein
MNLPAGRQARNADVRYSNEKQLLNNKDLQ